MKNLSLAERDEIVARIVETALAEAVDGRLSYEWFAAQINGKLVIGPDINHCLIALKQRGIKLYDATRKTKSKRKR